MDDTAGAAGQGAQASGQDTAWRFRCGAGEQDCRRHREICGATERKDPHLRSTRNIAPVGEHVCYPDRLRMPQQGRSSDSLCSGWGAHLPASWTRPRRRSRSRRPLWSRAWWSTARAPQRRHTQCLAAAMARLSGQNLSRCSERGASVRHRLHGACQSSWRWTEN